MSDGFATKQQSMLLIIAPCLGEGKIQELFKGALGQRELSDRTICKIS